MLAIVPCAEPTAALKPFYPKLSEASDRLTTVAVGTDVVGIFSAAVVQLVGPGGAGSAVRVGIYAQLRRHRSGAQSGAGRDESSRCKRALSGVRSRRLDSEMLTSRRLYNSPLAVHHRHPYTPLAADREIAVVYSLPWLDLPAIGDTGSGEWVLVPYVRSTPHSGLRRAPPMPPNVQSTVSVPGPPQQ